MKDSRIIFIIFILFLINIATPTHAAGLVPCDGPECQACHVVELGQNILTWLISISASIIAIIFAWAGMKIVMAKGSTENMSEAKGMMTNSIIGLVILLSAWLVIDTILKLVITNDSEVKQRLGTWNEIQCVAQPERSVGTAPSGGTVAPVTASQVPKTGHIQTDINNATLAYMGVSTVSGPDGGNKACAWAVNNILKNAGIAPIDGDSVPAMEKALQGGRGTLIDQTSGAPGDIVIAAGSGHVGICMNVGCTQVISNSSGKSSFSWKSGPDFAPSYKGGVGRIYRVTQ